MKTKLFLLIVTLLTLISATAHARLPFSDEAEARFGLIEQHGIVKAVWDATGNSDHRSVATHGLGVRLPEGAVVEQVYVRGITSGSTASGAATLSFGCTDSDTNNLVVAGDIDGASSVAVVAGKINAGVPVNTPASYNRIAQSGGCEVTATVGSNAFTGGKAVAIIRYSVIL